MITIKELVPVFLPFNEARERIEVSGLEFFSFTTEYGIHDTYPVDVVNTWDHFVR